MSLVISTTQEGGRKGKIPASSISQFGIATAHSNDAFCVGMK